MTIKRGCSVKPLGLRSAATLAANCENSNGVAPALGGFVYPIFGPGKGEAGQS